MYSKSAPWVLQGTAGALEGYSLPWVLDGTGALDLKCDSAVLGKKGLVQSYHCACWLGPR